MTEIIKIDLNGMLERGDKIILDLGCGNSKGQGRIGIDRLDLPTVDIVADIDNGLGFLPDNSVDEIHSRSFIEHIENLELFMAEVTRVLKKGGICSLFVPHFSNPYYYSDYTHKNFFGLYTFYYFVEPDHQLARKVPVFYTNIRIDVRSIKLVFSSPFPKRNRVKKWLEKIFNRSAYMQELYEENFTYIFPCYGLDVVFSPSK